MTSTNMRAGQQVCRHAGASWGNVVAPSCVGKHGDMYARGGIRAYPTPQDDRLGDGAGGILVSERTVAHG